MNQNNKEIAKLLFPNVTGTVEDLYKKFPPRKKGGEVVTRIAPSPTGFLHIGTLGMTLADLMLARANNGTVFLRIEDTDQKREVEGATKEYIKQFDKCGIKFDEGFDGEKNYGDYGPYVQSQRIEYYHIFAKKMVEDGIAYPCFCTSEQLDKIREAQEKTKQKTGYYGGYARCKDLTADQIKKNIAENRAFVIRANFSKWNENANDEVHRIHWVDLVKGNMSLPAEINDPVIIKSNGIPPYNLAHVVDDTLMRVTHVLRGEEWLVSVAQHLQLFDLCGIKNVPHYVHMPVICVQEGERKRKLSKRKDKEAIVENFLTAGYPVVALIEYLLTLYNTDFEMWRIANPNLPYTEFKFTTQKIGSNNPLFDLNKLDDISKKIIAKMTCAQINSEVKRFFATQKITNSDLEKIYKVLAIDRETEKPRKDIVKYSDIPHLYSYILSGWDGATGASETEKHIAHNYAKIYNHSDNKEQWFARIKEQSAKDGVAVKDYAGAIRLAITGRTNTPDLYTIMQIIGEAEVIKRLKKA